MIVTNSDKTKSNALFFTNQNSYADNINKFRYNQNVGINSQMSKNLRPLNKMNILPYKPEEKKLNSEINALVVGIILLVIVFLAILAFIIIYIIDKNPNKQTYTITAFYLEENGKYFNDDFKKNNENRFNHKINKSSIELKKYEADNLIQMDITINTSLTNISNMFKGVNNLVYINLSNINSFFINDFSNTFENCDKLEVINLTLFNTYNIKSMKSLFKGCTNLRKIIGLETINTYSLDNIEEMFADCENLSFVDLSSFKLDKIKNKNNIFNNNKALKYVFLGNSNNLNETIYTIFDSAFFKENNPNISIYANGHSKINSTWFEILNEEEIINKTNDIENERCNGCNDNTNNNIYIYCQICKEGYYSPYGNKLTNEYKENYIISPGIIINNLKSKKEIYKREEKKRKR